MRGDRPLSKAKTSCESKFTPHARGSTAGASRRLSIPYVYPACAGIDPTAARVAGLGTGLPRMRGDRPHDPDAWYWAVSFTPHARGSTRIPLASRERVRVYPACAGIDRIPCELSSLRMGLPRMRGDRPKSGRGTSLHQEFTPHARGSTRYILV